MDDGQVPARPVAPLVGVVQPLAGLQHDAQGHRQGHGQPGPLTGPPQVGDAVAVDVLHGEVPGALGPAQIEHVGDVGVVQLREQQRLVLEQLEGGCVLGQVREHALDRHVADEAGLTAQPRQVHLGHAAGGDLA